MSPQTSTPTPQPATDVLPDFDSWQLDITITDSPTPVPADCGSGDGCGSSCASACVS